MKKTIVYLAMSSCFVLGASIAHADSDSSQGKKDGKIFKMDEKMFKAMDKDSNGRVTEEEYKNYTKNKDLTDFNVWDVDGNRDINSREMKIVAQRNEMAGKSGGNSGEEGKMDDSWDQKHDDAWHKNSDSTWDKNRDDAWHKKSNSNQGGSASQSSQNRNDSERKLTPRDWNENQRNTGSKSGEAGKMVDIWDQKRDDAWHKNNDSTWDKKRDDVWHNKADNTSSGSSSDGGPSDGGSSGGPNSAGSSGGSSEGSSGGGH